MSSITVLGILPQCDLNVGGLISFAHRARTDKPLTTMKRAFLFGSS
jgi:hypothetical protein